MSVVWNSARGAWVVVDGRGRFVRLATVRDLREAPAAAEAR